MTIQGNPKATMALVVMIFVAGTTALLLFGSSLSNRVGELNETWEHHAIETEQKVEALYQIHKSFGYGGFIHHFKNLVLRLDQKYVPLSEETLAETYKSIDRYLALNTSEQERTALTSFRKVVEEYDRKLQIAKSLVNQKISQDALDERVKTDDSLAFQALQQMSVAIQDQLQQAKLSGEETLAKSHSLLDVEFNLVVVLFAVLGVVMLAIILRQSKLLNEIQILFRASPDALLESDADGCIRRVNRKATEVFGYSEKEFLTLQIEDLIPSKYRELHKHQREEFQATNRVQAMEDRNIDLIGQRKNGEEFPAEIAISSFETGNSKNCVSIVRDITQRKDLERRSYTDYLTQIDNRLRIEQSLNDEIARARRYQRHLSIILCDIDNFKKINDQHGHQAGDKVLVSVASFLKKRIRDTDFIGRWGGEEFLVCCPEISSDQAMILAEELRNGLSDALKDQQLDVTISLGVTEFSIQQDDYRSLLERADHALYQAKADGRNCSRSA